MRALVLDILREMQAEAESEEAEVTKDIANGTRAAPPDKAMARTLSQGVESMQAFLRGGEREIAHTAHTALLTVLALARTRVRTLPFQLVDGATLRGYTDASLLLSALDLLEAGGAEGEEAAEGEDGKSDRKRPRDGTEGQAEERLLAAVRRLDMAIIVAGAVGPGRREWVHAIMRGLQACLAERPAKRARSDAPATSAPSVPTSSPPSSFTLSPFAASPIPALPPPPLSTPITPTILRGYLSNGAAHPRWRALDRWRSRSYLLGAVGRGRVVPVEIGMSYDAAGWGQRIVPFDEFLDSAGWGASAAGAEGGAGGDGAPLYLAQTALFTQFPALEADFSVPEYVWADTPGDYVPPPDVLVNVWMGPGARVVSPAHTDPFYNCYAQVVGRKRVWLAPPGVARYMYAYGDDDNKEEDTLASEYMTNTSRVPILQDVDAAVRARFPRFFEHVFPAAMEAVLEPGDLLLMPPGWWHAMRGEGEGACWSVSFWY